MAQSFKGKVEFKTEDEKTTVMTFDPSTGVVMLGTKGVIGTLAVCGNDGKQKVRLFGELAECQLGGNGLDGLLVLHPAKGKNGDPAGKATIYLSAIDATARVGGNGRYGNLSVCASDTQAVVQLDAKSGDIKVGGEGSNGDLMLFHSLVQSPHPPELSRIHLSADEATVRIGNKGQDGKLLVRNTKGKNVIQIDGASGDILLENADCAEEFDVDDPAIEPGSVLTSTSRIPNLIWPPFENSSTRSSPTSCPST